MVYAGLGLSRVPIAETFPRRLAVESNVDRREDQFLGVRFVVWSKIRVVTGRKVGRVVSGGRVSNGLALSIVEPIEAMSGPSFAPKTVTNACNRCATPRSTQKPPLVSGMKTGCQTFGTANFDWIYGGLRTFCKCQGEGRPFLPSKLFSERLCWSSPRFYRSGSQARSPRCAIKLWTRLRIRSRWTWHHSNSFHPCVNLRFPYRVAQALTFGPLPHPPVSNNN
jgi:hypothetical protein